MIRLSLGELQRLVERACFAFAYPAISQHEGWQEDAARARDRALADGLRSIHLGVWAETLEKQTKIVTGD